MSAKVAIIELGGKQHLVSEGDLIVVNKLANAVDDKITLKNILNGESVSVKVVAHQLGKKINGLKFKAKTRYFKRYGHRQSETTVEVVSIGAKVEKTAEAPTAKAVAKKAPAKKTLPAKVKKADEKV